jgi:hypothetical protein
VTRRLPGRDELRASARGAVSARRWREIAQEWAWAAGSPPVAPPELSWPLDPSRLSRCVLRWPRRYAWGPARIWADPLLEGLRRHVRVEHADIAQPYDGIVRFDWVSDRVAHPVALDYWDYPEVNDACAAGTGLYFKMQYREEGYERERVLPGGFVPARPRGRPGFYRLLGKLREERGRGSYECDVYGRFSLAYATETRREVHEALSACDGLTYVGSLEVVGYGRFLREAAHARVCLDLPGNGDLCHRLVEYLGIGACVVSLRHGTRLHVPLSDGAEIAYAGDVAELVELCRRYAGDDGAREAMATRARAYFDRYLHRDQLAAYYLHELTTRLA